MKAIPTDIHEATKRTYTLLQKFVMEFYESEFRCVEVVEYHHKNARSCSTSIHNAIKRCKLHNSVGVCMRGNQVFLIKKR